MTNNESVSMEGAENISLVSLFEMQTHLNPYTVYHHIYGPTEEYVKWLESKIYAQDKDGRKSTSTNSVSPKLPAFGDFQDWYEKGLVYPATTQIYDWFVRQLLA